MRLLLVLEQDPDTNVWFCYCPELDVSVKAMQPKAALVKFGVRLRKVKREKLGELF